MCCRWTRWRADRKQNSIVAVEAMRSFMGNGGATFIAVLILLSTFGATNCQLMPHSRVYFAMARDGLFFRSASKCHPVHRTPSNSLIIQVAWASILVISGTFDQLNIRTWLSLRCLFFTARRRWAYLCCALTMTHPRVQGAVVSSHSGIVRCVLCRACRCHDY